MTDGRWLKAALAASLVVNVFVVGAAGGLLLAMALGPHGGSPPINPMLVASQNLTPKDRDDFQQAILDANQASGPIALDAHLARRELNRLMRVEPFDRDAATAAMARARSDDLQVRAGLDAAVLDFVAKLSPKERTALAEGFEHARQLRLESHPFPSPPPGPPVPEPHD